MIAINGTQANLQIMGNVAGENYQNLIQDLGATGAGQLICRNNAAVNMPVVNLTAAAALTLPPLDEGQIMGMLTSTATITKMSGLGARSGNKVTFVTGGTVAWGTSTTTDNCIGKAYTSTAAGDIITFHKYIDNLWYPSK